MGLIKMLKPTFIFALIFIVIFCSSVNCSDKIEKRGFISNILGSLTNKNNGTNEVLKPTSSNTTTVNNNNGKESFTENKEKGPLDTIGQTNDGNKTSNGTSNTEGRKKSLIGDIFLELSNNLKKLIGMAEKLVDEVNNKAKTWKAKLTEFANLTKEEKQSFLGLNLLMAEDKNALKLNKTEDDISIFRATTISIPKQFDARQQWSGCSPVIGAITDQSSCGSCWAVSTASVFNDRLCIQMLKAGKKPDIKVRYSSADLMSCSTQNRGCNGGVPKYAWDYIAKNGIVTGSEWVDKAGCKPYPFPPKKFKNNQNEVSTPSCKSACTNTIYGNNYATDKKYSTNPTGWSGSGLELKMQQEIMANGPINVGMVVYEDLMYYAGGVYQHITGGSLGGHAVRIIGWGEEKGAKYWLAANSWNTEWGEKGLFKIRRGTDESRIESLHIAFGTPKI